ncbi:uncharacterized protein TrAtP1_011656 [Trichoderma atroviride]|uniref:uncharacterized protein n=1 Tax=Hypocrea atroviridis TaxID=63577 RepID=UPI003327B9C1|nr:hypothetical protein TrAtP1_011656 [Trichoderma atroviride]
MICARNVREKETSPDYLAIPSLRGSVMAGLLLFGEAAATGKQQQQRRRIRFNSMPLRNYILWSTMPEKTRMSILTTHGMNSAVKASF